MIALGSNIGDGQHQIHAATQKLTQYVQNIKLSKLYITPPKYYADQPPFTNGVLCGTTSLEPLPLLDHMQKIEQEMGRIKTIENGPRVIDIDIILYGNMILNGSSLTLPHPLYHERGFVLVPACDVAADWQCPKHGQSIKYLCDQLPEAETASISIMDAA